MIHEIENILNTGILTQDDIRVYNNLKKEYKEQVADGSYDNTFYSFLLNKVERLKNERDRLKKL